MADDTTQSTEPSSPNSSDESSRLAAAMSALDDMPGREAEETEGDAPAAAESARARADEKPLSALEKSHIALKRNRERDRKRAEAERRQNDETRALLQQTQAQIQQENARLAKYRDHEKLAAEDPTKVLDALGLSFDTLATKALNPDDKAAKLEKQLAEMQRKFDERVRAEEERELQQRLSVQAEQGRRVFADFVTKNDSDFEFLSAFEPAEIGEAGDEMAKELFARGVNPTLHDVARAIEAKLASTYERIAKRRNGQPQNPGAEQATASSKPGGTGGPKKSLSNVATAGGSSKERALSFDERAREAMKLF